MFRLVSTSGDQAIDLRPGRIFLVGRAVLSDVPIVDPHVSRRHAQIFTTRNGIRVKDLHSTNGTFVNGAVVTEANAHAGDVITFGGVSFWIHDDSAPRQRPSASRLAGGPPGSPGRGNVVRGRSLSAVATALSQAHDLDSLLGTLVTRTLETMNVDDVAVLLLDEPSGKLVPRVSRSRTGVEVAPWYVPQSIARRACEQRVVILTDNRTAEAEALRKHWCFAMSTVRCLMCAPLVGSDQKAFGSLYVDRDVASTDSFSDEDLRFLRRLSDLTAVAIQKVREHVSPEGDEPHRD